MNSFPQATGIVSKESNHPKDNSSVIAYLNRRPEPSLQYLDLSLCTLERCGMVQSTSCSTCRAYNSSAKK